MIAYIPVSLMTQILPYIQVVLSILLVGGVLLQRSEAGLGAGFGSDSSVGGRFMRRGMEKLLFNATILIAFLFVLSTLAPLFLGR
jgi:protein translocase SecG subunit